MTKGLKKYADRGVQFCSGSASYGLMEILFRGYTHISMLIAGGICFCLFIRIARSRLRLFGKILAGALCVTAVEFAAGCIVNLWLDLGVWDYSDEPFHVLGQVCLRFTLLWFALSAVIVPICVFFTENVRTLRGFAESLSRVGRQTICIPRNRATADINPVIKTIGDSTGELPLDIS